MTRIRALRRLAAATALGSLLWLPGAHAGVFSASAFADVELRNPTEGVNVTWFNDVVLDDGFASNEPVSFYDNDALLADPADGILSTTLTTIGDAFAPGYGMANVSATLLTEGLVEIENTTEDAVELEFSYLYGIFATVADQVSGSSIANAFARVELFYELDIIVDQIVNAALGSLDSDGNTGDGSFSVNLGAGESAMLYLFVDAGGDASYVPIPATLSLLALGLAFAGVARRSA